MYFNSNMTFSERERFAYASGNFELAEKFLLAAEMEDEINSFEDRLAIASKDAYQEGYNEGFGTSHVESLDDMEQKLKKAQETTEKSKVLVRSLLDLFHTDMMKTVAGRKQIHHQLQSKLISLNY